MSERSRLAVVLFFSAGLGALLMLGLPLLYLTLDDPEAPVAGDPEVQGAGIYLRSDTGTWRLFPRAVRLDELPADAPRVARVDSVVVVARQPGAGAEYRIARIGGRAGQATVSVTRRQRRVLVVVKPRRLRPGLYEFELPRESVYGGTDYAYFAVSR